MLLRIREQGLSTFDIRVTSLSTTLSNNFPTSPSPPHDPPILSLDPWTPLRASPPPFTTRISPRNTSRAHTVPLYRPHPANTGKAVHVRPSPNRHLLPRLLLGAATTIHRGPS